MTAHATIQTDRTAEIVVDRKQAVSAGIFAGIGPRFWSPETPAVPSGRFLAFRLCSSKFRSRQQGFDGQYCPAPGIMRNLWGQKRRLKLCRIIAD
jgi:hypothetical protein